MQKMSKIINLCKKSITYQQPADASNLLELLRDKPDRLQQMDSVFDK